MATRPKARSAWLRAVGAALIPTLLVASCTGPLRPSPLTALARPLGQRPGVARLTLRDGTRVLVAGPHILDDHVVGGRERCSGPSCDAIDRNVALPLRLIRGVETPSGEGARPDAAAVSVMAGIIVTGLVVLVLYGLAPSEPSSTLGRR